MRRQLLAQVVVVEVAMQVDQHGADRLARGIEHQHDVRRHDRDVDHRLAAVVRVEGRAAAGGVGDGESGLPVFDAVDEESAGEAADYGELRALLRTAVFEMEAVPEVPARVIIAEYLEVAHDYYAGEEPGFVNAILDKVGRQLRPGDFPGMKG